MAADHRVVPAARQVGERRRVGGPRGRGRRCRSARGRRRVRGCRRGGRFGRRRGGRRGPRSGRPSLRLEVEVEAIGQLVGDDDVGELWPAPGDVVDGIGEALGQQQPEDHARVAAAGQLEVVLDRGDGQQEPDLGPQVVDRGPVRLGVERIEVERRIDPGRGAAGMDLGLVAGPQVDGRAEGEDVDPVERGPFVHDRTGVGDPHRPLGVAGGAAALGRDQPGGQRRPVRDHGQVVVRRRVEDVQPERVGPDRAVAGVVERDEREAAREPGEERTYGRGELAPVTRQSEVPGELGGPRDPRFPRTGIEPRESGERREGIGAHVAVGAATEQLATGLPPGEVDRFVAVAPAHPALGAEGEVGRLGLLEQVADVRGEVPAWRDLDDGERVHGGRVRGWVRRSGSPTHVARMSRSSS